MVRYPLPHFRENPLRPAGTGTPRHLYRASPDEISQPGNRSERPRREWSALVLEGCCRSHPQEPAAAPGLGGLAPVRVPVYAPLGLVWGPVPLGRTRSPHVRGTVRVSRRHPYRSYRAESHGGREYRAQHRGTPRTCPQAGPPEHDPRVQPVRNSPWVQHLG